MITKLFSLNKLLQVGVALLLMSIPLYPKFPILNIPNTYVAIRLEDILISIVTAIWVTKLGYDYITNKKSLPAFNNQSPTTKAIILFWIIGFLSLLSALFITQTILPHIGILHTLRRVEYMVVFFITLSTIKSKEDVRFYLEVILLTAFAVFVYGFGQKFFQLPIISTMNQEYSKGLALNVMPGGRINSTFAGHYDLAAYAVVLLNLFAAVIIFAKKAPFRLWTIFITITTYWLLLVSASRISFAAYLGSITITLWLLHKKLWIIPVILVSLLTSSLSPDLFNRYTAVVQYEFAPRIASIDILNMFNKPGSPAKTIPTPTPTIPPQIASTPEEILNTKPGKPSLPTPTLGPRRVRQTEQTTSPEFEDRSSAIRFKVEWPRALRAWYKNPLLGTGHSSITLATDNDFLRLLGEVGLLGLLSFLLIFVTLFLQLKKNIFSKPQNLHHAIIIGFTGATLGLLANAVFIDVFEASKIATFYWMLTALAIGTAKVTNKLYR